MEIKFNKKSFGFLFLVFVLFLLLIVGLFVYIDSMDIKFSFEANQEYIKKALVVSKLLSTIAIVLWGYRNRHDYRQGGNKRQFIFYGLCFSAIFLVLFYMIGLSIIYFLALI